MRHFKNGKQILGLMLIGLTGLMLVNQSGCYFFRKRDTGSLSGSGTTVYGRPIGAKAGGMNAALLAEVHAINTNHLPAAVRPDPDVFVRQLLLQFRDPGATVARETGRVEQYRLLLGGASEDFVKEPQTTYDATSLLAKLKVAEEVCEGLVDPDSEQHPGWQSILPNSPEDTASNIRYLAQRLMGVPSDTIGDDMIAGLTNILDTAKENGSYTAASYVPVCATLILDAGALLL